MPLSRQLSGIQMDPYCNDEPLACLSASISISENSLGSKSHMAARNWFISGATNTALKLTSKSRGSQESKLNPLISKRFLLEWGFFYRNMTFRCKPVLAVIVSELLPLQGGRIWKIQPTVNCRAHFPLLEEDA